MKLLLTRMLVAACALYLSGAHWGVLQMAAWTGMLVSRAQEAGLVEAVDTTFDGKHPCRMCAAISEGRHQEEGQTPEMPGARKLAELKLVLASISDSIVPGEGVVVSWPAMLVLAGRTGDAPPTPPPLA